MVAWLAGIEGIDKMNIIRWKGIPGCMGMVNMDVANS